MYFIIDKWEELCYNNFCCQLMTQLFRGEVVELVEGAALEMLYTLIAYRGFESLPLLQYIAGLCKGSTTDSDSVCLGSNPSPAAKR